jgi:hypothetical protein
MKKEEQQEKVKAQLPVLYYIWLSTITHVCKKCLVTESCCFIYVQIPNHIN